MSVNIKKYLQIFKNAHELKKSQIKNMFTHLKKFTNFKNKLLIEKSLWIQNIIFPFEKSSQILIFVHKFKKGSGIKKNHTFEIRLASCSFRGCWS